MTKPSRQGVALHFLNQIEKLGNAAELSLTPEERNLAMLRIESLAQRVEDATRRWHSRSHRFFGVMRIKNEGRWIAKVIESQLSICELIYIFDDHSTDLTREICKGYPQVRLFESPFEGLDESRDKQWILGKLYEDLPDDEHNEKSRNWALALDGDEVLTEGAAQLLRAEVTRADHLHVFSVRILYLWDSESQIRTDGVYGRFYRPSVFRLMNPAFRYQVTPFGNGANLHCSSIPQEYLEQSTKTEAKVLHLGYMNREDRLKKFDWYTGVDPDNKVEDGYAHMVLGDLPEFPADQTRLHAGPLKLEPLRCP